MTGSLLVFTIKVLLVLEGLFLHVPKVLELAARTLHQPFVRTTGFHIDHVHSLFALFLLNRQKLVYNLLLLLQVILHPHKFEGLVWLDDVVHHLGHFL